MQAIAIAPPTFTPQTFPTMEKDFVMSAPPPESPDDESDEPPMFCKRQQQQAMVDLLRQSLIEQRESVRETARGEATSAERMQKAMKIAARIKRGDVVPQSDVNFLIEQSPGMFILAMSARNLDNEHPERHDAVACEDRGQVRVTKQAMRHIISAYAQMDSSP